MKTGTIVVITVCLIFCTGHILPVFAQDQKPVQLPEPKLDAGKSLVQALKDRKTTREYSTDNLPDQTLSNLLWAASGINRPDSGRRTAPTAKNWQEIDVYVATAAGMHLYDPKAHALVPVASGDLRSLTYVQAPFKDAPVHLVFVADLKKMAEEETTNLLLAAMDTGFVAQNVYLYCASAGLNTGYRVSIDKAKLAEALKLSPTQRILGAQSVGLPKGK